MGRAAIKAAVLLGMVLGFGLSATGTELAGQSQHTGQHSGTPSPVTNPPITSPGMNQPGMLPSLDSGSAINDPGLRAHMEAERVKAANDDRHKKLVSDVDKLISLSNDLRTDVDKANKDELSLDVLRKAQEIEKLAHDVQSRMKN
jgi:hypothetical protein